MGSPLAHPSPPGMMHAQCIQGETILTVISGKPSHITFSNFSSTLLGELLLTHDGEQPHALGCWGFHTDHQQAPSTHAAQNYPHILTGTIKITTLSQLL